MVILVPRVLTLLLLLQTIFQKEKLLLVLLMKVIYITLCQTIKYLDLLHEDLEQNDDLDIEEKWHKLADSNDCYSNEEVYKKTEGESRIDGNKTIISVPKEVSESKSVTTNEKVMSEPKPKEVEPSCVTHVKTPRQPMKNQETPKVNRKNWNEMMERELGEGYSFIKKKCFVCGSLSHLIRDCDFYEKKIPREAEVKKQRVFNTGNGVAKPVWNNANRVNHANHFVPRPVQLNAVRPNSNSVRPNVNTVRQNVNSVRSNVNTVRPKQPVPTSNSNSFSPGNWGTAVKTSAGYNWRNTRANSNCNSGSNFVQIVNAKGSSHQELEIRGSVTFRGSKGYITDLVRSDNGTEFKNRDMLEFCGNKGIKQEYSNARTPQQNGDELELSETQKNRMAQVQEAVKYYTERLDTVRAKTDDVEIIRANGADTVYMSFGAMLKDFIREDLIELYRLVMQKYGTNRPEDVYDRVLWSNLRTMFDPPLNEDAI
ncbi:putative ribonuclease H-like domain-containing protein [Tanacetum coccineum]|uniref:Ribonuclease H-like domain-containing protein n=1 Tax=Tanacetum coccineum TaxID=301880 RepID=A0ABQ5EUQ9_9ASTR